MRKRATFIAVIGAALACSSPLFAAGKDASDTRACIEASERGQRLRSEGKLRDANAQFLQCARETCPHVVRKDCTTWLGEVSAILPMIVIVVRDADGHDVLGSRLVVDGQLAAELDGRAVPMDPGVHVIRVEKDGLRSGEQKVIVYESEKGRAITLTLTRQDGGQAAPPTAPRALKENGTDASLEPSAATFWPLRREVWPWLVVGAGAVAVGAGVMMYASGRSQFSEVETACPGGDCGSTTQLDRAREALDRAQLLEGAGIATGVVGVLAIAAGITWYFTHRQQEPSNGALRLSPPLRRGAIGWALEARF